MTQVHSVRVKKWTQLRPEDFNGTTSASLNARKRHTSSPEPVPSSTSLSSLSSLSSHDNNDNPPASPELPRFQTSESLSLSSSSLSRNRTPSPSPSSSYRPSTPSSYMYHQHVYYPSQSPSSSSTSTSTSSVVSRNPLSHSQSISSSPSDWRWGQELDSHHYTLPSSSSLPPLSSDGLPRRVFRHGDDINSSLRASNNYSPYSRSVSSSSSSSNRRNIPRPHSLPSLSLPSSAPSSPSSSHYDGPPSFELPSPPTSPIISSASLSSSSSLSPFGKAWNQQKQQQYPLHPLNNDHFNNNNVIKNINNKEESTVPESQDSVVPSVQKMKICNLILN